MISAAKTQDTLFRSEVGINERGKRLDLWLRDKTPAWSRKKVKQFLDNHQVTVNRQGVYMASWALRAGDIVEVFAQRRDEQAFVKVLYEDRFLLVIDKAPYHSFDEVMGQINDYLKRKHGSNYHPYLGAMHRLDRETSGVFIVTLDKRANTLSDQFRQHTLRKVYWAIVGGAVPFSEKRVTATLKKGEFKGGKKVRVVLGRAEGKQSASDFRVLERYPNATLLEVVPKTGRTHQIRAHLSALGYPIVGDRVYGEKKKGNFSLPRQALHAYSLQFHHPISGEKMRITAPLPKDMKGLLDKLRA